MLDTQELVNLLLAEAKKHNDENKQNEELSEFYRSSNSSKEAAFVKAAKIVEDFFKEKCISVNGHSFFEESSKLYEKTLNIIDIDNCRNCMSGIRARQALTSVRSFQNGSINESQ